MDPINALFNSPAIRSALLKLRYPLFAGVLLLLLTRLDPRWFLPGLIVSIFGELFQLWSMATVRTRKELTQAGPYMLMRNPMYIGRFFLIFGVLMMTGNPWIMAAFAPLYYFYMTNRVRREEKKLARLFGSAYEAYCRRVNRYLPAFRSFDPKKLAAVSRESFFENNAHLNLLLVGACYLILFVAACMQG
jgi:hypothetical protein